tara:strand:+ start:1636 stop:2187 length:552 start_codon:yes stop_codon:yes gene_type:complete
MLFSKNEFRGLSGNKSFTLLLLFVILGCIAYGGSYEYMVTEDAADSTDVVDNTYKGRAEKWILKYAAEIISSNDVLNNIDSDIDDYTDEALHTTRQLLASRLFSIEYINKYYGFIFKEKNGEMLENLYYKDRIYTAKLIARIDCIFEQRAAESVEQIPHYKFNDLSVNMSRIIVTKNFCEENM